MHYNNRNNSEQAVGSGVSVLQMSGGNSKNGNTSDNGDSVSALVDDQSDSRARVQEQNRTKTREDGDNQVGRSVRDWIAFCIVICMMVAASTLFILTVASSSLFSTINQHNNQPEQQDKRGNYGQGDSSSRPPRATESDNSLYKCELSYLQMDSSLIKFSIDHLIVVNGDDNEAASLQKQRSSSHKLKDKDDERTERVVSRSSLDDVPFTFDSIDYNSTVDELVASSKLDPKLPFIFFINGFNTLNGDSEISDTWMFDVAKSVALDSLKRSRLDDKQPVQPGGGGGGGSGPVLLSRLFNRLLARFNRPRQEVDKRLAGGNLRANVIFLTWSIPHIFADNVLAMVPAYYKTVANYELIVGFVAETIKKTVRFVERSRSIEAASAGASAGGQAVASAKPAWSSQEERSQYYLGYEFYGHSLGSHILSDAIRQVRLTLGLGAKFGKLTGLDPATPCFLSVEHGISMSKVASSVKELVVVHSNAGLAGLTSERADIEIVLNGGTFQPGCRWYDFACHHSRSTGILRYRDDECQMVAYKCSSYHHFKNGACETCDQPDGSTGMLYDLFKHHSSLDTSQLRQRQYNQNQTSSLQESSANESSSKEGAASQGAPGAPSPQVKNCVLVNLPEQHLDSEQVLQFAEYNNQIRQLADDDGAPGDRRKSVPSWRRQGRTSQEFKKRRARQPGAGLRGTSPARADDERAKKAYYHYVNTSPNFRSGRKSHCLQHYQLRLIMYHKNGDDKRIEQKCRPSRHLLNSNEPEIKLALLYEPEPMRKMAAGAADKNNKFGSYDDSGKQLLLLEQTIAAKASPAADKVKLSGRQATRVGSNTIGLDAIIKDMLHTTLLTVEREPKLFVGAVVDNIDLGKLIDCYVRENATSGPHFVLDVAFMSHTNQKVRHAYSSVLCGQLELNKSNKESSKLDARGRIASGSGRISSTDRDRTSASAIGQTSAGDTNATSDDQLELLLNLCKQSDLMDVSAQIDKLLNHIELHRLDDSWKVSLLNNLFSLFAEWEPF